MMRHTGTNRTLSTTWSLRALGTLAILGLVAGCDDSTIPATADARGDVGDASGATDVNVLETPEAAAPGDGTVHDDAPRDAAIDPNDTNLPEVDATDAPSAADAASADAADVAEGGLREISVRFVPQVGAEVFQCGRSYASIGAPPSTIEPLDFRFYVHAIRLIDEQGTETPLELVQDGAFQYRDVALLDFEDGTGACNQGDAITNAVVRGLAPDRRYTALRFTLGVPFDLNHKDLSTKPSPLDRSSLWWQWRAGHIFLAAASRTIPIDVLDAGSDAASVDGAALDGAVRNEHYTHVGSTGCGAAEAGNQVETTLECLKPNRPTFTVTLSDPDDLRVVADFAELKKGTDVAGDPGCHSFPPSCEVPFRRLGIDWATGAYTPATQTVFRAP